MSLAPRKRRWVSSIVIILAICGIFAVFPTVRFLVHRFGIGLTWRGVERHDLGPIQAYRKSTCGKEPDCRCVLLIHGLGDSAFTWYEILTEHWKVPARFYAIHLPQKDRTPLESVGSVLHIDRVAELIYEHMSKECPSVTAVGNSLGGWIALQLALKHSQFVRSGILINSAGLDAHYEEVKRLIDEPTVERLQESHAKSYAHPVWMPQRLFEYAVKKIRARKTPETDLAIARLPQFSMDRKLKLLNQPFLIIWGKQDRLIENTSEAFHAGIRKSKVVTLDGCGHAPQQECPEAVRDAMESFLAQ